MTKIKVSKAVASFIDDYARNMSHDENWKDKLLVTHVIQSKLGYQEAPEKVRTLQDVTPMELAEILHNGYKVIEYTENNIPSRFKFKHDEGEYTAVKVNLNGVTYVNCLWKDYEGELQSLHFRIENALKAMNKGTWCIIEE